VLEGKRLGPTSQAIRDVLEAILLNRSGSTSSAWASITGYLQAVLDTLVGH
jgi:hypothetical protein